MTNADSTGLRPLTATYRMQLHAGFTCEDARAVLPHVEALGASHVYLSPVLTAVPGSEHGYDVLDHTTINPEIGGRDGLERLAADAHARRMGVIVDVVPNHMALVSPLWRNAPLWAVLREGRHSAHAHWFDVDWDHLGGRFGLPVLGRPLADAIAAGEITVGPVDERVARRAARLHVPDPMPDMDALIAATALEHGLTLVTRNIQDFQRADIDLLNPWEQ